MALSPVSDSSLEVEPETDLIKCKQPAGFVTKSRPSHKIADFAAYTQQSRQTKVRPAREVECSGLISSGDIGGCHHGSPSRAQSRGAVERYSRPQTESITNAWSKECAGGSLVPRDRVS